MVSPLKEISPFSNSAAATLQLRSAIADRIEESELLEDARIQISGRSLTQDEIRILGILMQLPANQARDLTLKELGMLSNPDQRGVDGLLRKGAFRSVAVDAHTGAVFYALTEFGRALGVYVEKFILRAETKQEDDQGDPTP